MKHAKTSRAKIALTGVVAACLAVLAAGSASAQSVSTNYTYDSLGRVVQVTINNGSASYIITYSYDAAGNRTVRTSQAVSTWGQFKWGSGTW